ncbi:MAG: DNA polymerase III subunit alpha [Bacteroidetes bacterium]|nr:DNA polymerase III subunit alpha [Bacteroidota bacterium]
MFLNCHSYFSLRYGILSPGDVAELVVRSEIPTPEAPVYLCLTDINCMSGIPDFFRAAQKHPGLKPCAGIDFREGDTGGRCLYIGIARNEHGFAELNRFLSEHRLRDLKLPEIAPAFEHSFIIYPFERTLEKGFRHKLREYEFIGVRPEQLQKLRFSPWKSQSGKLLALCTATFRNRTDHNTHRLLRCMANNCLLSKLPDGEAAPPHHQYTGTEEILHLYRDAPVLVHNTLHLLEQCSFMVHFGGNQNKKVFTGDPEEDFRLMTEKAFEGLRYRYPRYNYATKLRLENEMKMIYELGFTSYFLISWDICRFAREQGFYYVGRGSGANSMAAYCLQITDVDPIDLDLYFERFINPFRTSPPDFDLDFSWQDRDTVTDYIFKKHGTEHTALLATYSTFQANAVVRELGKVFGLPKEEIDHLLDKPTYFSPSMLEEAHKIGGHTEQGNIYSAPGIGEKPKLGKHVRVTERETLTAKIMRYAHRLHESPNYRSIHAGGILISDKPIFYYSALDMPPKGFQTVQWSMLEAEDLGLAKFDILSQRGLGHIKDAIAIIKQNQGEDTDIHRIQEFKKDDRIRRLISTGHTMGCFYVESPAMRQLLRKLKCEDYLTLVAASSVIRPGVARSGMMRGYIERHIDPEKRKEAHPVMMEIMPDTYGIMVYQEDVIKVAHHFAGLGLAESDVLRRGMSGKFRSREEFQKVKERFFILCKEKGHSDALAAEVWFQIESFAGYSFAKGHSASYAVESYQSLYLKAYYPLEFYVGVINNFGGFYRTEFYVHAARMCGADVQAPDVNHSGYLTGIRGKTIYLGLVHVASLEQKFARQIVAERDANGAYKNLYDFKERTEPGLEQLKILIRMGAFRFTGKNRKELMWEAHWMMNKKKPGPVTEKLFREPPKEFVLPNLSYDQVEDAFEQIELLGFPLCNPFDMVAGLTAEQRKRMHTAHSIARGLGKRVEIWGYLVTIKPTRTIKGQEMNFGTWLDHKGHFFDTTHFPDAVRHWPFKGRGVYRIVGVVVDDFGVLSVDVEQMEKMPYVADPRWE